MSSVRREPTVIARLGAGLVVVCASMLAGLPVVAAQSTPETAPSRPQQRTFDSPKAAVAALLDAATTFDTSALEAIFGPDGDDIIHTGEPARDKKLAADFVAKAREKQEIDIDPKNPDRAQLIVGAEDWPFPVPLVKRGGKWFFDSKAGRQELLYRRIGANELDAIEICHGYVEAQHEYALQQRNGYEVNQYAQRIVSSPGKRDGLA